MKKLQNPTTYFFQQAEKSDQTYNSEIDNFVKQLINKNQCQLCKHPYDTSVNVPRIMVHCGHTFCTPCLSQFYMNRRVRCPMCLKLVKHLDSLQRLPINHTIFQHISQEEGAARFLFSEYERVQREAHQLENPQRYDPDSGLPFCVFHSDRIEHFHCETHATNGCRVCIEIGHEKPQCKVIDLYDIEDPQRIREIMNKVGNQPLGANNSHPEARQHQNVAGGFEGGQSLLDNDDDDLFDDSSEERHSF